MNKKSSVTIEKRKSSEDHQKDEEKKKLNRNRK